MKRTYLLNIIYLVLILAAFIVPRFYKDPSGGFAAAATAVFIFLAIFAVAGILASYQFIYTYRRRDTFSRFETLMGMLPFLISLLSCLAITIFLRYQ